MKPLDYTDFIGSKDENEDQVEVEAKVEEPTEGMTEQVELEVQKQVVQSLAADKVDMSETIDNLRKENYKLKLDISAMQRRMEEMSQALDKVGEVLTRNSESEKSSQISLLDRQLELPDRFECETYDHVLEVLRAARDWAEKEGMLRKAQLLEGVLVANEPSGNLKKKREWLEKLFADNQNIVNGPVMEALEKAGIVYKEGDNYLLPKEIIKREY